jgi:hypothetical protein
MSETEAKVKTQDEKENRALRILRLMVSKRFCYSLIAILLAIIFVAVWIASSSFNNDFANRFMPTLIGIIFNFAIFIVFFDLREKLEWKEVEDRVKKRIGSEIFSSFTLLTYFCEVDRSLDGDIHNRETWKKLERKQLKQMTEKVVLNELMVKDLSEKKDLALNYASLVESNRIRISEIEGKYFRFLNLKLRTSLMDIQDYLGDLRFEVKVSIVKKETIEKIAKEIASIQKSGIDIGI